MKTKEELNALKEEVEALNRKLAELSEDELKKVIGGAEEPDIRKDEYESIIMTSTESSSRDSAKIRTGDSRKHLTEEQLTPEYIHEQIFGKKYDALFRN